MRRLKILIGAFILTVFLLLLFSGTVEIAYSVDYVLTGEWLTACEPMDVIRGCAVTDNRPFVFPAGIAVDLNGSLYLADLWTDKIQKFTSDGKFITQWGSRGSGDGEFLLPVGVELDSFDNLYITDIARGSIQKFTSDGKFITQWGSRGSGDGEFLLPVGVATDLSGNVFVVDQHNNRIQKFTNDGKYITKWGKVGSDDGFLFNPRGIATDQSGNVFVVDQNNNRIQKFTNDGEFITKWGSKCTSEDNTGFIRMYACPKPEDGEFYFPAGGIATDATGNVFVVDQNNNRIQKFTNDGEFITKWSMPRYDATFSSMSGLGMSDIAVDSKGRVYTTIFNDRVLIYSPEYDALKR
jgi:DNA-binding beta-propeller fold protein YncE